ncbi:uncharacterized protein LOC115426617 isoform X2 [Sphaeramia orbicularis]|uniref:uncharacterized protein LOC115426617 isoform X2 n=1 Tax=Sphaeramia orbicularis TaxID=375764 RepID=UPI00117E3989|nr:uncharacterized protein LOC115426617 isoform X2 [Sphaeramia orbicularis]
MSGFSLQDMTLLCLTLASLCFCLSSAEEQCYGSTYRLPFTYTPRLFFGQLFFTPSNGGDKRLVLQNKKLQDPRFTERAGSGLLMKDLTEQDDGVFSVSLNDDGRLMNVITLEVKVRIPERPAFLEFTPSENLALVTVIWNYTNLVRSRGSLNGNYWDLNDITQEDSGYYKFRGKDNKLLAWKRLEVIEYERHHVRDEGKDIYITYPDQGDMWTIIFTREENQYTLLKGGTDQMSGPFGDRLQFNPDTIIIDPLQYEDSGTFEFRDKKGNLAQRVELEVKTSFPAPLYYVIIVGSLFLVFVICCCVKKCCCKKSSSKRNNPAPQPAAAPAVYYHDTTQPTGPSQSTASPATVYSYQPTSTTDGPPTYNQVNVSVNPPRPEVAAAGGQGATPLLSNSSDFISSDSDPRFDMKGISFASAPPLNSDTTISDVYTSDKLNFL